MCSAWSVLADFRGAFVQSFIDLETTITQRLYQYTTRRRKWVWYSIQTLKAPMTKDSPKFPQQAPDLKQRLQSQNHPSPTRNSHQSWTAETHEKFESRFPQSNQKIVLKTLKMIKTGQPGKNPGRLAAEYSLASTQYSQHRSARIYPLHPAVARARIQKFSV